MGEGGKVYTWTPKGYHGCSKNPRTEKIRSKQDILLEPVVLVENIITRGGEMVQWSMSPREGG